MLKKESIKKKEIAEDHRLVSKKLDLYFFNDSAGQGLPFLCSNWVEIKNLIEEFIRHKQKEFGFQEVVTPILGSKKLYEVSGHLEHYEKNMFPQVINEEGECFFLRPMTCPHHCLVFSRKLRSYKELPIRICENSVLHRYEPSGSLKGLERVRWMELSDHHVFVTTDGLKEEFKRSYSYVSEVLKHFNFKISRLVCSFSDLNEINKYHDDIDLWNYSENLLLEALVELKLEFVKLKGEAAFYGPKLDIEVETSDGKNVTIATIQIDFVLPKRFDLKYIEKDQKSNFPVIIHLSPIGTYQRFIAIMLEQTKGKIPFWLCPIQIEILPINDRRETIEFCKTLSLKLFKAGIRCGVRDKKSLNFRIKSVHERIVPYYFVVGTKEIEENLFNLVDTSFNKTFEKISIDDLINKLYSEINNKKII